MRKSKPSIALSTASNRIAASLGTNFSSIFFSYAPEHKVPAKDTDDIIDFISAFAIFGR